MNHPIQAATNSPDGPKNACAPAGIDEAEEGIAPSRQGSFTDALTRAGANLVLITVLLPYVSPIVLPDMDVQLMALGTSLTVLLVLLVLAPGVFTFGRDDLIILGFGLLSLVYVNPDIASENLSATLRACGQIVLAFPVYYAVRNLYRYMSPRVFVRVVALYCAVLFLQVLSPSVYASTFAHLLSDARWAADEGRGPNGLCTEPSMMGNVCVLFVVSMYFFHREYWKSHKNATRFIVAASCVMLLITKSGTGVILALVVALAALLSSDLSKKTKTVILAASLLLMGPLGQILSSSESRSAFIFTNFAGNPLSLLEDYSLADRMLGVYVGLDQIPGQPFGSLDVRINPDATNDALNGDVAMFIWPDSTFRALLIDLRSLRYDNHGTGAMVERMGIPGALILATFLLYPRGFKGKWVVRAFMVGMLLNASLFISTLWFVLGCCIELQRTECPRRKETVHGLAWALWNGLLSQSPAKEAEGC